MSRGKYSAPRTSPTPSRARNVPTTDWQRSRDRWSRQGKKAPFFGCSTPFLWASTKEMGSNRRAGQRPPSKVSAHTYKAKTRRHLICAVTSAPFPRAEVSSPYCSFHPISLLLRKKTGWSPKETRLWVPPREQFGPARLSHELEAPTSPPTASS